MPWDVPKKEMWFLYSARVCETENITEYNVQASEKLIHGELSKLPDMDYKVVITKDTAFAHTVLRIQNSRENKKAEKDK